jgi:hypothetical protein
MANINCIAVIASDHVESSTMSLTSSIEPSSVDALSRDFAEVAKQLISFDAEINTGVGGVPRHKQPARVILDSGAGIDFTTAHHERNSDAVVTHPNRSVTVQGIGGQTTSTAGQGTWTFNVQDVNGQSQPLIRSEAQIRTSLPGSMPFDTRVISAGAMVKQENCKMVLNFPDEMYLETASGIRYALEINDQNIVVFCGRRSDTHCTNKYTINTGIDSFCGHYPSIGTSIGDHRDCVSRYDCVFTTG